MFSKRSLISFYVSFILLFSLISCGTTAVVPEAKKEAAAEPASVADKKQPSSKLTMCFAGDVMAHSVNYKNGKFSNIWRDLTPLLSTAELCFANIEAPVADKLEWSTYPNFNMHSSYVEAAIDAGFNVFSLANNHTNDQYLDGIKQTKNFFDSRKNVWASGLKETSGGEISYTVIEKDGWKILFVAITELLNRPDFASYINYYPSSSKKREQLKKELSELRSKNECDLFILSVHTDEPEYIKKITESHKVFYRELINDCGIDIIWANHPHLAKDWETIETDGTASKDEKKGTSSKAFIMYANGNTISGQRTAPSFTKTETERDYTGDGIIFRLTYEKSKGKKAELKTAEPFFITTYINPSWQFVVKRLDDDFIKSLDRSDHPDWASYLKKRMATMQTLKDLKTETNAEIQSDMKKTD